MFVPLISTACAIAPLVGGLYGVPMWSRRRATRALADTLRDTHTLVLNYDDGPGATLTPALIDLLEQYDVGATFFPTGFRAIESPRIMDRLLASKHELGSHSFRHLHAWRTWPWQSCADANRGYEAMSPWIAPDALFRPPYGKMNWLTAQSMRKRDADIGWWTVDSRDTRPTLPPVRRIVEDVASRGGGSVLMHDFDRHPCRHEYVLQLTASLLELASTRQWQVMTLGDVLRNEGGSVAA